MGCFCSLFFLFQEKSIFGVNVYYLKIDEHNHNISEYNFLKIEFAIKFGCRIFHELFELLTNKYICL